MQTIYAILRGIGLFLLLLISMCLIGIIIGIISFKLNEIKPIAGFFAWCKKTFNTLASIGMLVFAVLFAIAIWIKFFKWIVIIVLAIGHFFVYLYHLIFK